MAKMGGERSPANYDGWDFRHGRRFESEVVRLFGSLVHHPSSSPVGSFLLLTIFRRSSFRLNEELVGMALHSVWVVLLVVFILNASSLAIFISLLLSRRLDS
jgi:hypothetical protein